MSSDYLTEKEQHVLELAMRRDIYALVKRYAGAHFRELVRKSGLATGSVQYHLDYLHRHKLIRSEKEGNQLRYYPKNIGAGDTQLLGLLRQRSIRSIIITLLNNPRCNHEDVVNSVPLSPSTISWHLKKLEKVNVISMTKKGRKTELSLTVPKEEIIQLLITYQDTFLDRLVDNTIELWELK